LNTPGSRSIASLCDCTRATHFRFPLLLTMYQYMSGDIAVNSLAVFVQPLPYVGR
jgi:hypothetical protein